MGCRGGPRWPWVVISVSTVIIVACGVILARHLGVGPFSASSASGPVRIDAATFPDEAVRKVLLSEVDLDGDGELSPEEAAGVSELTIDGAREVAGLGSALPSLRSLTVEGDAVESVDVSDLPGLERLDVPDSAEVSGLDGTELEERWAVEKYVRENVNPTGNDNPVDWSESVEVTRDAAGRVTSFDGNVVSYDDQGRIASVSLTAENCGLYDVSSTWDLPAVASFTYDDAGRLAKISCDSGAVTEFSYDEAGRMASRTVYSWNGSVQLDSYSYDDAGRLVEASSGGATGSPETGIETVFDNTTFVRYSYDSSGHLVSRTTSDVTGRYRSALLYACDEEGRVVETRRPWNVSEEGVPGDVDVCSYAYDGERLVSAYSSGYHAFQGEVAYDEHGNVVSATVVEPGSSSNAYRISFEYGRYFVPQGTAELEQVYRLSKCPEFASGSRTDGLLQVWLDVPGVSLPDDPYVLGDLAV